MDLVAAVKRQVAQLVGNGEALYDMGMAPIDDDDAPITLTVEDT